MSAAGIEAAAYVKEAHMLREANPFLVPTQNSPLECNLCEMAWRPLSSPRRVCHLHLSSDSRAAATTTLQTTSDGKCHGLALWAEFEAEKSVLSTGPQSRVPTGWSQALQLLKEPLEITEGQDVEVRVEVDGEEATICIALKGAKRQRFT
ncbi:PRMT7 [Symbiodinium pilosum]|uniref:PRMT7 protein n=1 Tax=Symbiodinium pilosum TaxID=2952 RepID=A0A812LUQ0_SYMPI|nr:PRMT7 [Symbiodinium pilosum]